MQTPPIPSDTIIETDNLAPGTVYPKLPVPIDNGGEVYFDKSSYMVAMREGTLYDSVLKLRPAEGKSAANICGYEMLATGTPFVVDAHGKMGYSSLCNKLCCFYQEVLYLQTLCQI